jgi:hypothetical protein
MVRVLVLLWRSNSALSQMRHLLNLLLLLLIVAIASFAQDGRL